MRWHDEAAEPPVAVSWSEEARRELRARGAGRRLLIDYFATRCCGRNISVGDLQLRWTSSRIPIADEYLPMPAPEGIEAFMQRDLVSVLRAASGRIAMHGWGWFRRPVVEVADGPLWLDFIGSCRTRNPLGH